MIKGNYTLLYAFFIGSVLLSWITSAQEKEKTRVLYILYQYPQISETYMDEEIASLWDEYDINIISIDNVNLERKNHFPYRLIHRTNKDYLEQITRCIEEFKPHVLHSHWLLNAPLLEKIAEKHHIPFTLRTHSFDVLLPSPAHLKKLCQAASSKWCRRILCFPGFSNRLIKNGLDKKKVKECWPVVNFKRFYNAQPHPNSGKFLGVGAALPKKSYEDFINLAHQMKSQNKKLIFNLYITGYDIEKIREYNKQKGNPVTTIDYVEPEQMPEIYREHDWLIYTSNTKMNTVGLPVSIAEAQASGIGVCWQELPGRREQQLAFLDGAGYLFKSINELPKLFKNPYPEKMRRRGLEAAKKCDIEDHKILLTEIWNTLRS